MRFFLAISSIVVLVSVFALAPSPLYAQGPEPLVQCGTGADPCTVCDLISLGNRLLDFAFVYIVLPLVTIGIIAAGITIATARGSMTQVLKGRQMLLSLLIGFFIAASAWVIIKMVLVSFVDPSGPVGFLTSGFSFPLCP